jgi:flagellin-like hook-associated protein FlgL
MAGISAIPTTRVSDLLVRQRIVSQMQYDQLEVFKLQSAISSGRRISVPSEDASAALRAVSIQRLLERKLQVKSNITTNQSFLNATESSVAEASSLLSQIRGSALGVIGTTATEDQRKAVVLEINQALEELLSIGNKQFRGRYLFGGSITDEAPYGDSNGLIEYLGDEKSIQSHGDIAQLFETNVPGSEILGGISEGIQGTVDVNPVLSARTRLVDLRGGQGISDGSISISDGSNTKIIDISSAETIGDVARLLEANPPEGRTVQVTITEQGLDIEIDALGGGNLRIREVGGGTTVSELGILAKDHVGTGVIVGGDLNPRLTLTTSLDNILGVRSRATMSPSGSANDLILEATDRGIDFNDVTIGFLDTGTAGGEVAIYDDSNPTAKTLIISIESGVTTANQVIAAIEAEGTFTARLDPHESNNSGAGAIQDTISDPTATGNTSGGSGVEFDQTSGFQIVNGGVTHTFDLSGVETVSDLLNLLNGSDAGVLAEINQAQNGFNIRSRLSGTDLTIGENGGSTATELGIRTFNSDTRLSSLNFERGVHHVEGTDFVVRRKDGLEIAVDVSAAQTVQDVIDQINNDVANTGPERVTAQLAEYGNGIQLLTDGVATEATFAVVRRNASFAATHLGLVPDGQDASNPAAVNGPTESITGLDVNPLEAKGVFTALIRLRDALRENNQQEIARSVELLDEARLSVDFSRAEIGARQQGLDTLFGRLETEEIELRETLSLEIETDLVSAISEYTARQAAFQASLQTAGQLLQLTLLDFL